jgi:ketosteroid isomerase-like protein
MDHADTVRGLYAALNAGDLDGFGAMLADDFVEHEETPGLAPTKAGVLEFFRMYRAAFPTCGWSQKTFWPAATR